MMETRAGSETIGELFLALYEMGFDESQVQAALRAGCFRVHDAAQWFVIDPCTGSYFDDNGIRQKHWRWWDLSEHVHAPPFQPITLKLSSSIEVKLCTPEKIYLTFCIKDKKVTFNVGSKLLLKDPNKVILLKSRDKEHSLYLKKYQIYNLLNNIDNTVRLSKGLQDREEKIQSYVSQICDTLKRIRRLANNEKGGLKEVLESNVKKQLGSRIEESHINMDLSPNSKTLKATGMDKKKKVKEGERTEDKDNAREGKLLKEKTRNGKRPKELATAIK